MIGFNKMKFIQTQRKITDDFTINQYETFSYFALILIIFFPKFVSLRSVLNKATSTQELM